MKRIIPLGIVFGPGVRCLQMLQRLTFSRYFKVRQCLLDLTLFPSCACDVISQPSAASFHAPRTMQLMCMASQAGSPSLSPSTSTKNSDTFDSEQPSLEFTHHSTPQAQGHADDRTDTCSHQRGYGKIVALSSQSTPSAPIATHLTDLRHSSPMRLVPSRRSHPTQLQNHDTKRYEAALLHLSSYGGGLVPGDGLHLDIDVCGEGAVVCILTQGGQRIYRPGEHFRQHDRYSYSRGVVSSPANDAKTSNNSSSKLCQSTIECTVEPGGTLMYLPDPTVPYYQSSFQEKRTFTSQYTTESSEDGHNQVMSMGSIIAVDWYSSGRRFSTGMEEERWAFDYLATRTEFFIKEQNQSQHNERGTKPALVESMVLDNTASRGSIRTPAAIALGQNLDAMATLLLHGPNSAPVAKRAKSLSHHLASLSTRTRSEYSFHDQVQFEADDKERRESENILHALGGTVLLSVTPVKDDTVSHLKDINYQPTTHMVRILAESNEDIYRVLHHCLKPCSFQLGGFEPYKDRIHSSKTLIGKSVLQNRDQKVGAKDRKSLPLKPKKPNLQSIANQLVFGKHYQDTTFDSDAWFRLCTLSDSALPVGSFAHSLGIEAASQIGLFNMDDNDNSANASIDKKSWSAVDGSSSCSVEALSDFIHSVSRSNARFSTPLVLAGYSLLATSNVDSSVDVNNIHETWLDVDNYIDTLLRSNDPGRRASMDQGLGLLRIAPSLAGTNSPAFHTEALELIRQSIDTTTKGFPGTLHESNRASMAKGHAAPIYGIISASLGIPPLDACRVFAFGAARDTISAAVRLNLVGPMEGLSILDRVGRVAVEEGLDEGLAGMVRGSFDAEDITQEAKLKQWLHSVATCAPVMDAVQPLHDLLSVRLFRT